MKLNRITSLLLALCLVISVLPMAASAEIVESGTCGDGLTWVVADEVLTISGSGAMANYSLENPAPWSDQAFYRIKVGADVTYVGEYAFANLSAFAIRFGGDAPEIAQTAFTGLRLDFCEYPAYNDTWTEDLLQEYGAKMVTWCTYLPDGVCGENVTWELNEETGVMTISGTGPMDDFGMDGQPWYWDGELITSAVIGSGVTTVGSNSFAGSTNLTTVSLPDTLEKIGGAAFRFCPVSDIEFSEGLTHIYELAFQGHKLETITLPASVTYLGTMAFGAGDNLTRVDILGDLTYAGAYLFSGCINLRDIWFYGDAPETLDETALNNLTSATIHYPAGNDTWTAVIAQEFDSEITWEAFFPDVQEGEYYYEPVMWAVENNITTGKGSGDFAPAENCTRAQVVTFLWRAAGCPEPQNTNHSFTDVEAGSYYEKAVLWAVENGITAGKGGATTFKPDLTCSRAEVVTFLWRAKGKPAPQNTENTFPDVPAGSYYEQAVLWAVENGITTGKGNGTFAPADACTRAHVVTFLYRAFA